MKRILGSILSFDDYSRHIKYNIFGFDEYEYFYKLCDIGMRSVFTIQELKDPSYGFKLAYDYCRENQTEFPEILVFANNSASKALCKLSLDGKVHIDYLFGVERYLDCSWDDVLNELDETLDVLYRITDA